MKIGWVGLGKLGLPIVQTLAKYHSVKGYDIVKRTEGQSSLSEVCEDVDLIFIAVQTPHASEYEGITDMPKQTAPFDLTFLQEAVVQVRGAIMDRVVPIVIVSTVLPGDIRTHIAPFAHPHPVLYNPAFIAMGTVEEDFLNPEFVLIGHEPEETEALATLRDVYIYVTNAPVLTMSIESAELTKVAYNTFISQKIVFANTLAEICENMGAGNVDDVLHALHLGTKRILSPKYLSAGMGDGGPCHPRDNIAMAHIAKKLLLSADPFSFVVRAREAQSRRLAGIISAYAEIFDSSVVVLLGRSYKPGVDIETGSAGLLLEHHLRCIGVAVEWDVVPGPATYVLCLPEPRNDFPAGSVIIDPWGVQPDMLNSQVIRIGRHLGR